ncbi:hypothetical protein AA13595_1307 [Gluconacetobacter johannae DSM 13595]|uniref:gp53-like domain-containing protein n=1 Tax=Gluconacetobacter johannae TaxID=112140 RepID=UPI001FE83FCB|nr:hypothetical protein [Gluconacetobacter johannae]GBQ84038.1 hypothetical protein AA13595_1307 [Gluconacetobacter johannae DSM 13595]
MELIIAPNTVTEANRDVMPVTGTPGWATDGNPAQNIPATGDLACHYNMMMAEIVQTILDAGLTLDRTNWGQLSAAIQKFVANETTRATTVESNLQSGKAAVADLQAETARAEAAEAALQAGKAAVADLQAETARAEAAEAALQAGIAPLAPESWVLQALLSGTGLSQAKANPGYQMLPGGFILQFGAMNSGSGGTTSLQFPVMFPSSGLSLIALEGSASGSWASGEPTLHGAWQGIQNDGATVYSMKFSGSGGGWSGASGLYFFWFAIGF